MNHLLSEVRATAKVAALVLVGMLVASVSAKGGQDLVVGNYSLELDGVNVGLLSGVRSSHADAAGENTKLDQDFVRSMNNGPISWQEIKFQMRIGMGRALYDWMTAETSGNYATHDGAIVLCNIQNRPIKRLEFTKAVIESILLPGVSVFSTAPGDMYITLSVTSTKVVSLDGSPIRPPTLYPSHWPLRQFELTITNFDCSQVKEVSPICIYGRIIDLAKGNLAEVPTGPDPIAPSTMHLRLAAEPAGQQATGPFAIWLTNTRGKPFTDAKTGTLQYKGEDGRALFTLTFPAIGISTFTDAGRTLILAQHIIKYKVELPFSVPTFSYSDLAIGH